VVAREFSLSCWVGQSYPHDRALGESGVKKFLGSKAGGNVLGVVLAVALFILIGFVFGIGGAIGGAIAGGVGFGLGSVISNACKEKEVSTESDKEQ